MATRTPSPRRETASLCRTRRSIVDGRAPSSTDPRRTSPDDLRAVFVLYELEQETVPEIATTLALPVGTVSSRLRRARELFQAAVRRRAARNGGVR
ncbi:MAG: hypothetical protein IPJ34_26645 [Myxococcales bacterium]|nr:hypothetical protein [Myxococcales bacterium]